MKNIEIVGVLQDDDKKDIIVSLFGGDTNVVGTLTFHEPDENIRHDLRHRVTKLMREGTLVDLAMSVGGYRWRLIASNGIIIGGYEPTKLMISQTIPKPPKQGNWGLERPWDGED